MLGEAKAYDLVIIGGGPAGIVGAATAKASHKTVALVDNHRELGGAGVNTGTVPSKTLRETALALSGIKARKLTGLDFTLKYEVTIADFLGHEQHVKAGFNSMISQQLKAHKADVYLGPAPSWTRTQSGSSPARCDWRHRRRPLSRGRFCSEARASSLQRDPLRCARRCFPSAARRSTIRTRF